MATHIQIGNVEPRVQYTADGVQTEFVYPFPAFADGDISVYLESVLQTTGYSVTGAGVSEGGSVIFDSAPASGTTITLIRLLTIERTSDFLQSGELRSKVLNDELDYITAVLQQLSDEQSRSARLSVTESVDADMRLPTPEANAAVIWNTTADGLVNGPTTDEISNAQSYALSASSNAALTAADRVQTGLDASASAASAAAAAATVGTQLFGTVVELSSANSPKTLVDGDNGTFYSITMDGDVVINLPSIAAVGEGDRYGFFRMGASNTLTLNPNGTDTVNGLSVYTIDADTEVVLLIADDASPDNWIAFALSQTFAGAGLNKSGSTLSLDHTYIPNDIAFSYGFNTSGLKEDVSVRKVSHLILTRDCTFDGIEAHAETAPTGAAMQFDVKKNGVTIFSSLPQINAGANVDSANAVLSTTTASVGDRLSFEITQVGSIAPGQGVTFSLKAHLTNAASPSGDSPVYVPSGSSVSPGLYISGDSDTGFFKDTANEIAVSNGGEEVFRFGPEKIYTHKTGWNDLVAPLNAAKLGGVNDPNFKTFQGGLYAYAFDPTAVEEVFLVFHVNHDIKPNSTFHPHIHWAPESVNTGTVRWGFEYSIARGHGQDAFTSPSTVYIEQAASGTLYQHQIAEDTGGITFANLEPDTVIVARLFRDASHANDTYTGDAFAFMADLHYQSDRVVTLKKSPNFYGA